MKTVMIIGILLSATLAQAASYYNWDSGGSCRELTPAGNDIRGVDSNICRQSVGSMYKWDSGGACRELTPAGNDIRGVDSDICRYEQTDVVVKLPTEEQEAQQAAASKCAFSNEDVMFSYTHKVAQKKTFKDSRDGLAMDQCQASGYTKCLVQRERSTKQHENHAASAINFLNPFSYITGVGFKESYTSTKKGVVIGYTFKIKSNKEMRKDMCPQLNLCALSATESELSQIRRISDQIACPK